MIFLIILYIRFYTSASSGYQSSSYEVYTNGVSFKILLLQKNICDFCLCMDNQTIKKKEYFNFDAVS